MTLPYAVLLLIALLWVWRVPAWRPRPLPGVPRRRPLALGHRGARGPRPENTVSAFELAFAHLDGIEADVQLTRDGVLVLWHDFDCRGREIAAAEHDELRALVPNLATLADLFDVARAHPGTLLNLEIKSHPRLLRRPALERALVAAVRRSGLGDRVLISSFDPLALARVRLLAPRLRTALLIAPELPRALRDGALAGWLHVDALHPEHTQVDAAMRARARARRLPLHVWTVNDADEGRRLLAADVAGLIGDDPVALARVVKGGR